MRIASNKLTGSPTPLVVEVPAVHAQHTPDLEGDKGDRYYLPGMIVPFHPKSERMRHPLNALEGEVPEMLRRGHQPPASTGNPCRVRSEIAGSDQDDTARAEVARAERERLMRAWQMLEDIEQRDDIHHSELREIVLVGHAREHAQTLFPTKVAASSAISMPATSK